MHSSWPIWDFFKSHQEGSFQHFPNKMSLVSFDDLSLFLMRKHLFGEKTNSVSVKILMGQDVQYKWVEEEFLHLSFFQEEITYVILNPDELNSKVKELILSDAFESTTKKIFLAFTKETPFSKKWSQKNGVGLIKIEAPKFWENFKLIEFCCTYLHVPLSFEAKNYILEAMDPSFNEIYHFLEQIKIQTKEQEVVEVNFLKEVLHIGHFDQFKLATLIGKKQLSKALETFLQAPLDWDRWRTFFAFMQGHLIRFYDTSYLDNKPRLTQYDKEIQALSKLWDKNEILMFVSFFQAAEHNAKLKDSNLIHELQLLLIKSFHHPILPVLQEITRKLYKS